MKKGYKKLAVILGLAIIAFGFYLIFVGNDHTGYNGGVVRASTSTEYGGDFYTDSSQYTGLAANAVCDLYDLTRTAFGAFFVFLGGMDICLICGFSKKKEPVDAPVDAE